MLIGVISDTHGLLRPEAVQALAGSELIIHAGDVGNPGVLHELRAIAPLIAVRGNVDTGEWAADLPDRERIEREGAAMYVLHDLNELDFDPTAAGLQVVISGHSHKPVIRIQNRVLYLNPGSAGPRRFKLPVTLARLLLTGNGIEAELVHLVSRAESSGNSMLS